MTKAEFIEQLTLSDDIESKASATRITELAIDIISKALASGDNVDLSGLGNFSAQLQKGKSGKVPGTDKTYTTQDKMVPKFKASAKLKRTVAGEV